MELLTWLKNPWPWYVAGPLIGLMVPLLLILGNRSFGISSSLRHICASCFACNIAFFKYDWKKESWNLFFVFGIFMGGILANHFLLNPSPIQIHPDLAKELAGYGIYNYQYLVPQDWFHWQNLTTLKGILSMVGGGFLVGFGTRYAGGCTSGHAIMGLSNLQWPSLVATVCFMLGGFISAHFIVPFIFSL